MGIEFRVLGALEVVVDGQPVSLGGPRQRAVLAMLLLQSGRPVSTDRLIDEIWGGREGAERSLQVYISALRRALRDPQRIRRERDGYLLAADEDGIDAARFEKLVRTGTEHLLKDDYESAAATLRRALVLWRGEAYADLAGHAWGLGEASRLRELQLVASERWFEAELALGHHSAVIPEIQALVGEEPLREGLRAQLMLALYRAGRQSEALEVYQDARRALREELGLEPGSALTQLQVDILRHEPHLAVEPAELRRRRRLPAPATALVGRRREVEALVGLLKSDARLVTVTGPGGVGKTRLALQAAHKLAAHFADGVLFVGLAALRDPALVPARIASALGIVDARPSLEAVVEHLSRRAMLLLLDNFEQVDEAAPILAEILAGADSVRLLVTSRHRLRLYGEHGFPLSGLDLDQEAVPLFIRRAAAAGRTVRRTPDVRAICTRLDCLPLAIELAAARVGELTPAQMLASLGRLELARDGPRDVPDRQRALELTIRWSYELLDARQRELLARLSVFAGGFTREAARAVADATPVELDELLRRSLLARDGERLTMLETIREFAGARLNEMETAAAVRHRHGAWALALAEEADAVVRDGADAAASLDRLEVEHDNLRAALDWLVATGSNLGLRLAVAMGYFWVIRGHMAEGEQLMLRALDSAPRGDPSLRAQALLRCGVSAKTRGDLDTAASRLGAGLEIARAIDDPLLTAKALRSIATLAKDRGDYARALALTQEAALLSAGCGDWLGELAALINLADASLSAGDDPAALSYASRSVDLARKHGHAIQLLTSLLNRGLAQLRLGSEQDAARDYREALEVCASHRYREGVANALLGLAALTAGRGDARQAALLLGSADQHLATAGAVLESTERPVYERTLEHLRAVLSAAELAAQLGAGASLSASEAIDLGRRAAAAVALGEDRPQSRNGTEGSSPVSRRPVRR